jgi:hypothetical protein
MCWRIVIGDHEFCDSNYAETKYKCSRGFLFDRGTESVPYNPWCTKFLGESLSRRAELERNAQPHHSLTRISSRSQYNKVNPLCLGSTNQTREPTSIPLYLRLKKTPLSSLNRRATFIKVLLNAFQNPAVLPISAA